MNYIDLDATLLRHNLKDEPTNIFMCEKFVLNGPDILLLACCSASGYTLPPMLLFNNSAGRRRSLNNKMMSGEIPGTLYTFCDDYTIDSNVFEEWFSHLFLRHAPSSRPLLLLMEESMVNIEHLADRKSVVVFTKPANLDPGPFTSLRSEWKRVIEEFRATHGRELKRNEFTPFFSQVWLDTMTMDKISTGFRKCGICPLRYN